MVFNSINKRTAFHRMRHHIVHMVEVSMQTSLNVVIFIQVSTGGNALLLTNIMHLKIIFSAKITKVTDFLSHKL